jgi:hypothetical protein
VGQHSQNEGNGNTGSRQFARDRLAGCVVHNGAPEIVFEDEEQVPTTQASAGNSSRRRSLAVSRPKRCGA